MAKKKSTQVTDQVKNDEVTYAEELGGEQVAGEQQESFFAKYAVYLIGAGIIIIGIFLWSRYGGGNGTSEADMAALGQLSGAEYNFQRDSLNAAINGDAQFSGFMGVIDDNSGSDAANMAKYYLGLSFLKQGDYAQGLEYLEDFSKGDNMVSASALAAMGYAYEQQGDFAAAAEKYKEASTTPEENDYSTPFYLMDAARNLDAAGNSGQALDLYKRIKKEFPNYQDVQSGLVVKYIAKYEAGA